MNCGFVYVRERRSSAEIAKAWDDIWGGGYSSEWPAVQARLFYVAEYLHQLIDLEGKSICDIGAGEGTFMDMCRERLAFPFGIEPDRNNCRMLAAKGHSYFTGTVEDYTPTHQFDLVTLNWTLENTGDCIGVLRKAREFLKPDGHICVATGSRILVPFKKPLHTYFSSNPPDLHCFRFSAVTLEAILAKAGFGFQKKNDYDVNDWLVMTAKPANSIFDQNCWPDNPAEVLAFFERWEREWP